MAEKFEVEDASSSLLLKQKVQVMMMKVILTITFQTKVIFLLAIFEECLQFMTSQNTSVY